MLCKTLAFVRNPRFFAIRTKDSSTMRQRFEVNPDLNVTPIEKIIIPLKSRDELPPLLAGLQWLWTHSTLKTQILELLDAKINADKKRTGRPGMELWQLLVLGVVRLGLDANYDRLEHIANFDTLVRQMLGIAPHPFGQEAQLFNHQTLRDNVSLVDEELLQQINALVAASGRPVFKKKDDGPVEPLAVKVDTFVLETDVHFPTDLNLLWDAGRKCLDFVAQFQPDLGGELTGWRKLKDWRRRLKGLERQSSKAAFGGGKNKETRVRRAVGEYLRVARELSVKVGHSLQNPQVFATNALRWLALGHFQEMVDKHVDLVERRLLHGEVIPTAEKVYSLFEPHTEWIAKGKQRPAVELGHRICVATDQHGLVQDYRVLVREVDVEQSAPVADRLLGRYGEGSIASISFDKGFSREEDRQLLELYIPVVVMPKRGKKNAGETEREHAKKFIALRKQHSAVESDINALEHHGLDRCPDVGLDGFQRYVGYGVLALNLHRIGKRLQEHQREQEDEARERKRAA